MNLIVKDLGIDLGQLNFIKEEKIKLFKIEYWN